MLIVYADMLSNKKHNAIVTKQKAKLVFITQSNFVVPKNVRLNSMGYFIMKIPNKQEFQEIHLIIHQILMLKT